MSPAVEPGSSPLTRGKHPHHARNDQRTGLIPAHAGKTSSPGVPCCASWAHPHSRGENIITGIIGVLSEGSSPLTRGKLSCCLPVLPVHGLIPAHAGKTSPTCNATPTTWDHPRSRGENRSCCSRGRAMSGSSPLTRGKRSGLGGGADRAGIIPAHAGKTRLRASWAWRTWAHPRLRGENPIIVACRLPAAGSSPLTQGKPMPFIGNSHPKGIIPAHAGKTRRKPVQHDRHRDHPRSRGENTSVKPKSKIAWGSSPLTRGKHAPVWSAHAGHGLIPARAWKTGPTPTRAKPSKAHPRSRGENFQSWVVSLPAPGSSPLTRGKRGGCNQAAVFVGLIPTHAGKTLRGRSPYQCPAAHPRSRGENDGGFNWQANFPGSSPLTRGKHRVCVHHLIITGLIPAHAGKTRFATRQTGSGRAHPRSRGENFKHGIEAPLDVGSYPLTRGKRARSPWVSTARGIIPAHAGKTQPRRGTGKQ